MIRVALAVLMSSFLAGSAIAAPQTLAFDSIERFDGDKVSLVSGEVSGKLATHEVRFTPHVRVRCQHLAAVAKRVPGRYRFVVYNPTSVARATCALERPRSAS